MLILSCFVWTLSFAEKTMKSLSQSQKTIKSLSQSEKTIKSLQSQETLSKESNQEKVKNTLIEKSPENTINNKQQDTTNTINNKQQDTTQKEEIDLTVLETQLANSYSLASSVIQNWIPKSYKDSAPSTTSTTTSALYREHSATTINKNHLANLLTGGKKKGKETPKPAKSHAKFESDEGLKRGQSTTGVSKKKIKSSGFLDKYLARKK